jgi:transcription initiation factor TFIIE subunit alpha
MRLNNDILNEVISDTAGSDVVPLVEKLKNKKNFSELKLAEALDQEINYTRNQLYRLLKYNLVSFTKKKDKRKGWYVYFWTFRLKHIKHLMVKLKEERLERLKDRLKRETENQFYSCKEKCMRISFDNAVDLNYMCPECAELLNLENNQAMIEKIKEDIINIEKFLEKENKKK